MFAGIDTHKDTLAVAVIDSAGRQRAGCEVPNTEQGFAVLAELFTRHHVTRIGIEGSGAFGRAVAIHLAVKWSHSPGVPDPRRHRRPGLLRPQARGRQDQP